MVFKILEEKLHRACAPRGPPDEISGTFRRRLGMNDDGGIKVFAEQCQT